MPSLTRTAVMVAMTFGALVAATATRSATAANKSELKVGFAVAQTGPSSSNALELLRSYEMWRDQVNAAGGLFVQEYNKKLPINLIEYDDKSDPSTATKLYERLITVDGADLLLSPWGSGINFAASAITEKHGINFITASASAQTIFQRGFTHIFQASENGPRDAQPIADFMLDHKDQLKTIAVLYENNLFPESIYNSFIQRVDGKGLNLVMQEKFPFAGQSFSAPLTKAKALGVDAMLAFSQVPSTIYMTRQMNEIGFRPKLWYVLIGPQLKEFGDALGPLAEGTVEGGFWDRSLPYPGVQEFADAYEAKYKRPASPDAAHGWMAVKIWEQAIAKAGTLDQQKLNEVLHTASFETVGGVYKFDAAGQNAEEKQFLIQVQNGKRTIIYPADITAAQWKPLSTPQ
jgi:branched-chain amino acid transport system substrate-binding protein